MSRRLLAITALLPVSARAGCLYKPFEFQPEKNDGVVVDVIVDAGSSFTHNFGKGSGYTFTDISFAHEPENGKVVKAGTNRFIYTPDKGFTGKDAYVFGYAPPRARRRAARQWGLCRR